MLDRASTAGSDSDLVPTRAPPQRNFVTEERLAVSREP